MLTTRSARATDRGRALAARARAAAPAPATYPAQPADPADAPVPARADCHAAAAPPAQPADPQSGRPVHAAGPAPATRRALAAHTRSAGPARAAGRPSRGATGWDATAGQGSLRAASLAWLVILAPRAILPSLAYPVPPPNLAAPNPRAPAPLPGRRSNAVPPVAVAGWRSPHHARSSSARS